MGMDERAMRTDEATADRPGEIFRLENELEMLTHQIEGLEAILEPVLNPPTPEAVLDAKREPRSRLADRIDRLQDLTSRLAHLKARISL